MESLSSFRHIGMLLTSPMKAMTDVKKAGWVTPLLCLSISVGGICNLPWRSPEMLLQTLKSWAILQLFGIISVWAAGLPQGGRGTLLQTVKVASLLTLIDGLAYYYLRFALPLPPLLDLLKAVIVVLFYLAVKAVHEYGDEPENDGLAFRVTASAFFIYFFMVVRLLPR